MKSSVELKQERASKIDAQEVLANLAKTEANRSFSDAENTKFDALQAEIDGLSVDIARAEKFEVSKTQRAAASGVVIGAPAAEVPTETSFSLLRALRSLAKGHELHKDDLAIHVLAQKEMRASGLDLPEGNAISIPTGVLRAQTVDGDSGAKGSALVASTPQLVRPLQPVLPIASLGVNIMSGLTGDVPLPTSGAFSFSYSAETNTTSGTDVGFAGPTLTPHRCSGVVDISKKLLAQTSFSVEDYIINQINIAYGNAVTLAAINGSGDAPTGLYSLIATNVNTTAGALTDATAIALEGLVDAADGTNVMRAYLADPKVKSKAKGTFVDSGSGVRLSDGATMNSYPFISTTLMPILDTDKHPIIFGDWNQLTVGYWDSVSIIVDPYTQAASGKVRLIIEGFSDIAVTNEKAFAINKVVTI